MNWLWVSWKKTQFVFLILDPPESKWNPVFGEPPKVQLIYLPSPSFLVSFEVFPSFQLDQSDSDRSSSFYLLG